MKQVSVLDVYDTIQSILDANGGEIRGRTAIQKLVYLAAHKIQTLEIPPYKPHYYGPYSQGVSHALEKLVSYSFVSETQTPGIIFGGYRYKLTDDSIKTIARINDEYSNEYNEIKKFVKRCKDLCKLDISQLSYASKILYMTDSKSGQADALSFEDAVKDAKNLGWDVSPGDVERGANLLKELKLVKIQQN